MAETSQNTKNIHRHNMGGIIFASVMLILIAAISLIVTFSALSKDEGAPDDDSTKPTHSSTAPTNPDDPTSSTGATPGTSTGATTPVLPPASSSSESVESIKANYGALILLDETHLYTRPVEELITRGTMAGLSAYELLSKYNFTSMKSGHNGDFVLKDSNLFLDVDAAAAFRKMMSDYVAETSHKNIYLRNAYYYDKSEDIASTPINEALLNPHALGTAVDIQIINEEKKLLPLKNDYPAYPDAEYYDWFINNCHKYGFIHTGDTGNSYSSFRYIGACHSTYMTNRMLTLGDYLDEVRKATSTDRLVIPDGNGNEWWVYYVKASDAEKTDIPVFGKSYSISGDNEGGFIVTIDTKGL